MDWLATVHLCLEKLTLRLFTEYCEKENLVVYSGGCAQNTVINETICRNFPNTIIPPHCYDGGLSLGAVEYLRGHYGLPPFEQLGFPFWQEDQELHAAPEQRIIVQCSELLQQGRIVGWYQGNGELGPRALGHRSILMDPRIADAKNILNSRIKHREFWRPFAPSVLLEDANAWFDTTSQSPYMLRAIRARSEIFDLIPAVVHRDGTSRVQTVDPTVDSFYELITAFKNLTGVPVLLNTSLNDNGSPIVGSRQQALDFFATSELDAICIDDQLLIK